MRGYIDEIKAERLKTQQSERNHIYNEVPDAHFPFTHGDSLEVVREQNRREAHSELKLKQQELDQAERDKLGDTTFNKLYGSAFANLSELKENKMNPGGYIRHKQLQKKMEEAPPFYL